MTEISNGNEKVEEKNSVSGEFRWYEGLAICLSMIAVQLCSEVINQWGLYFYSPSGGVGRTVYVSIGLVGYIFIIGTFWDAFSSPLVGALSDKTPTRPGRWRIIPIYGRRRPYIFFGSLLMVFTMIGFWFPPTGHTSLLNFIYGTILLCAHWTLFSVAVIPLNALGPEIARSETARVALGTWTAIGMIIGLAMANALPGVLISKLDPSRIESHLSMVLDKSKNSGMSQKEIENWLQSWGLTGDKWEGIVKGEPNSTFNIQGSLFEALQEKSITRTTEDIFHKLGIKEYQKLPRKAFRALQVSTNLNEQDFSEKLRKEVYEYLKIGSSKFINIQKENSGNKIYLHSKLLEGIEEKDLAGEELKDKEIALQGETLSVISSRPFSEEEINGIREKVLSSVLKRHLMVSFSGENQNDVVIFSRALTQVLALAGIQNSLSGTSIVDVIWVAESFSPTGYRRVATVFALISFVLFLLPVIFIRERYDSEAIQSEPLPWGQGLKDALRNKPFMIYAWSFFLFTIGFLAVQRVLPYWAELGLDGDESTITFLLIPFILVAILSYAVIPIVARYLHMKWLMFIALGIIASGMPFLYVIGKLNVDFTVRTVMGMILFGYCGIGKAIIYVMMIPMLGDIIDYDEKFSGERREAVYNGLSAFIWKASMAGSIWLASQSMSLWGNSIERYTGVLLVGPFAGIFGLLGMILISLYPSHWREE